MSSSYNDRIGMLQYYTSRAYEQEESARKYSKLLASSHSGGCCRKCSKSTITRFGLVRCNPKSKTVNGFAICSDFGRKENVKV